MSEGELHDGAAGARGSSDLSSASRLEAAVNRELHRGSPQAKPTGPSLADVSVGPAGSEASARPSRRVLTVDGASESPVSLGVVLVFVGLSASASAYLFHELQSFNQKLESIHVAQAAQVTSAAAQDQRNKKLDDTIEKVRDQLSRLAILEARLEALPKFDNRLTQLERAAVPPSPPTRVANESSR